MVVKVRMEAPGSLSSDKLPLNEVAVNTGPLAKVAPPTITFRVITEALNHCLQKLSYTVHLLKCKDFVANFS